MHTPYASNCTPHCTGCMMLHDAYRRPSICSKGLSHVPPMLRPVSPWFVAMSSSTIEGPQLRANLASIRCPERRPRKGTFHMEVERDHQQAVDRQREFYSRSQAGHRSHALETSSTSSPASLRCGHPSDRRGRLGLVIGVPPMQVSTRACDFASTLPSWSLRSDH